MVTLCCRKACFEKYTCKHHKSLHDKETSELQARIDHTISTQSKNTQGTFNTSKRWIPEKGVAQVKQLSLSYRSYGSGSIRVVEVFMPLASL